jgi:hypothetical protein
MVTVCRGTIAKALREELGTVELTKLTAGAAQKALANLSARVSRRTVQMAHNVLVRAIRHAKRDDLVGRNVAALVKPPKGQRAGRPSKSLTLEHVENRESGALWTFLRTHALQPPFTRTGCGAALRYRIGPCISLTGGVRRQLVVRSWPRSGARQPGR